MHPALLQLLLKNCHITQLSLIPIVVLLKKIEIDPIIFREVVLLLQTAFVAFSDASCTSAAVPEKLSHGSIIFDFYCCSLKKI